MKKKKSPEKIVQNMMKSKLVIMEEYNGLLPQITIKKDCFVGKYMEWRVG